MTGLNNSTTNRDLETICNEQTDCDEPIAGSRLQSEQLEKLAVMVASGELPIPLDWNSDRLGILLDRVHRIRRRRLVELIARAVASDLCREERQEGD